MVMVKYSELGVGRRAVDVVGVFLHQPAAPISGGLNFFDEPDFKI